MMNGLQLPPPSGMLFVWLARHGRVAWTCGNRTEKDHPGMKLLDMWLSFVVQTLFYFVWTQGGKKDVRRSPVFVSVWEMESAWTVYIGLQGKEFVLILSCQFRRFSDGQHCTEKVFTHEWTLYRITTQPIDQFGVLSFFLVLFAIASRNLFMRQHPLRPEILSLYLLELMQRHCIKSSSLFFSVLELLFKRSIDDYPFYVFILPSFSSRMVFLFSCLPWIVTPSYTHTHTHARSSPPSLPELVTLPGGQFGIGPNFNNALPPLYLCVWQLGRKKFQKKYKKE